MYRGSFLFIDVQIRRPSDAIIACCFTFTDKETGRESRLLLRWMMRLVL